MIPSRSALLGYAVVVAVVLAAGASLHSFWLVVLGVVLLAGGYERERRDLEAQKERELVEIKNEVNNQLTVLIYAPELQKKGWKKMVRESAARIRLALNGADMVQRQDCILASDRRRPSIQHPDYASASDSRHKRKAPQPATDPQSQRKCAGV